MAVQQPKVENRYRREFNKSKKDISPSPSFKTSDGFSEIGKKAVEDGNLIYENKKRRTYRKIKRLAQAAELGLSLYGAGGSTGDISKAIGTTAGEMAEGEGLGKGLRSAGSNLAGYSAAKKLAKKKYSIAKSSAAGGAIAEALRGGSISDIAKSSWSWVVLNISFKALWTVIYYIPAIIYLNFHYFMNKIGFRKIFGEMILIQKIGFFAANFLFFIGFLILMVLVYYIYDLIASSFIFQAIEGLSDTESVYKTRYK